MVKLLICAVCKLAWFEEPTDEPNPHKYLCPRCGHCGNPNHRGESDGPRT